MQTTGQADLTRIFLVILIIAVLITGSLWTLLPFLGALIWATTIVVATWPLMRKVQEWLRGRRAPATAVMTLVMLATFIVPSALAVTMLLDAAIKAADLVRAVSARPIGPPPAWLDGIPLVGARLDAKWQTLAAGGPDAMVELLRPFALQAAGLTLTITGGVGTVILHFLLTVVIAAILYTNGEAAARGVMMFGHRLGKEHGRKPFAWRVKRCAV